MDRIYFKRAAARASVEPNSDFIDWITNGWLENIVHVSGRVIADRDLTGVHLSNVVIDAR
jgi:hypothetical protein